MNITRCDGCGVEKVENLYFWAVTVEAMALLSNGHVICDPLVEPLGDPFHRHFCTTACFWKWAEDTIINGKRIKA